MPNEFVVKNGLIAQNNSIVSGSLIVTNGITGSLFGTSSQAVSASFTATASYGFFVVSASYAFTASSATNSTNALTASSADNFVVRQSLTASNALVNGRLTAQTLVVSTISSSVVYSSGSNIFGSNLTDVQQMTGSLRVTGSGNHWILGGNVGIGTTSPTARLHVSGTTGGVFEVDGAAAINALYVSASGNVGIGNTAPTSKLQINSTSAGAATVGLFLNNESNTSNTEIRLAFAANTNNDIASNRYSYISALNTSGVNGQALIFATNETGNSAVERMRITSAGNVGIGTTSPSSILTVSGSNTSCLLLVGSPGAASALFVSGSGNVGIGTTSIPNALGNALQLGGSTTFMSYVNNSYFLNNWYYDASGNARYIGAATSSGYIQDSSGNHKWFSNPSGTANATFTPIEYMRLTSAGNVGIGTTSPSSILTVSGSNTSCLLLVGSPGASSALFVSGSGNVGIGTTTPTTLLDVLGGTFTVRGTQTSFSILSNYAGQGDIPAGTLISLGCVVNNNLGIIPNGNGIANSKITAAAYNGTAWRSVWEFCNVSSGNPNLLLVKSGGSVGIGTTTPSSILTVSGSNTSCLLLVSSPASSSLFFVSGSGNIGIGTITPEFKLDISGSGQARIGAAEVGNWPSVTNYAFFGHERLDQTAAGNYALLQDSGGNTYVNAPTGKFVALRNSNTTIATVESARFTLTGSFGFSGSMLVTGSITGSLSGSVTGSLFGTASQAITASFAQFAFSASFAPGFSVSMSQLTPATTWSFTHNLNSRNPIVQVYDTTFAQIIPNQIVGINNSLAEIRFDYAEAGYAVASNGGGLYVTGSTSLLNQTSAAVTWSFTHNLNSKYVAFEIYDSNDNVIIPSNIRVLNENSAEIHLSTAITGRAVAQFSGISGTPNAFTASYALTASFVPNLNQNVFITGSLRTTGSVSITGSFAQTSGYMVLSQVSQSLNYADDTAAAAAGVPLGGIYRNGNFILIRLS